MVHAWVSVDMERRRGRALSTMVDSALDPQGIAYRDFGFGGTDPEPLPAARAFKPKDRPPHVFVMRPFPADDNDEQIVKLAFTKHQMVIGEELWFPVRSLRIWPSKSRTCQCTTGEAATDPGARLSRVVSVCPAMPLAGATASKRRAGQYAAPTRDRVTA